MNQITEPDDIVVSGIGTFTPPVEEDDPQDEEE